MATALSMTGPEDNDEGSATKSSISSSSSSSSSSSNISSTDTTIETNPSSSSYRIIAWLALGIAVFSMSSGGIWFALLPYTPPAMKVTWRLFLTSLIQLPGFLYQFIRSPTELRIRWFHQTFTMIFTGIFLAIHFISWSWSISHTSLTHSLLFVSTTPLLLVLWMIIKYLIVTRYIYRSDPGWNRMTEGTNIAAVPSSALSLSSPSSTLPSVILVNDDQTTQTPTNSSSSQPSASFISTVSSRLRTYFAPENSLLPTKLEGIGAIIGFLSVVILLGDAEEHTQEQASSSSSSSSTSSYDAQVTIAGDAMALLGAGAMCIYLGVGGKLRKWMPLFLYAFPVTFSSAIVSLLLSLSFESNTYLFLDQNGEFGPASFLGWWGDGDRCGLVFGAAIFSGIMGHTFANFSLSYINPLIVSVCILAEPLVGSLLGWAIGIQGIPSILTLIAGPLLLVGAFFTTIGARDSGFNFRQWKQNLLRYWRTN